VLAINGALIRRLEGFLTKLAEAVDAVLGAHGAPGRLSFDLEP
jgi:hypothetical protein